MHVVTINGPFLFVELDRSIQTFIHPSYHLHCKDYDQNNTCTTFWATFADYFNAFEHILTNIFKGIEWLKNYCRNILKKWASKCHVSTAFSTHKGDV